MGILDSIGTYLGDEENRLRLASGFQGLSMNPNAANIQQGFQNRLGELQDDRKLKTAKELADSKLQLQTQQAMRLIGQEYPDIAQAIQGGFMTPSQGVIKAMARRNAPEDKGTSAMQEYYLAVDQGFTGDFNSYILGQKAAGAPKTTNEITLGDSTVKPAKPDKGMQNITDNKGYITQVPIAGGPVDLRARKDIMTAENSIAVIDKALNHVGLSKAVGPLDSKTPNLFPDAIAFQAIHDQIKGTAFLEAYNTLKGGGQITQIEGEKAEAAQVRLNMAQDEEDYKQALREFKAAIMGYLESNKETLRSIPRVGDPTNDPLGLRG